MNGRLLAALALLVVIAALATDNALLLRLGYVLVGVFLVAFCLSWTSVRWLDIGRRTRARRTEVGGLCEESFTIVNRGWIPKPWLEMQDHSDLPGHRASRALTTLGAGRTRSWVAKTRCRHRGIFTLGPMTVAGGDPLGMFRFERQFPQTAPFVVYPRTVPLPGLDLSSGYLPGGPAAQRRAQFTTTNVRGVRHYEPGDAFNRIHWRTTARRGRLFTKEFELDPVADIWLVVDMERGVHVGQPLPVRDDAPVLPWQEREAEVLEPLTEEYAVTIAASLGRRFLDAGKSVGLVAHGQRRLMLQPDRGDRQIGKMLAHLAVLRAAGQADLAQVLTTEGHEFSRHMNVVCITPSTTLDWVEALRALRYRGVAGLAVVIEASTFGDAEPSDAVLAALAARNVPARRVRNGDDLALALRS